MSSNWSYTVTHYDADNSWANQVITDDVVSIPMFTDAGSGEVNGATLILSANRGHYIRDARSGESGFPTKIKHFDRIRIRVSIGVGNPVYEKVFDVIRKIPIKSKSGGTRLRLDLLGIEHWWQKINYATRNFATKPNIVFQDIFDLYNANKGTLMPTVSGHLTSDSTNGLPNNVIESFEFGINEDTCYNRAIDIIDKMGASGDNGGVLDYFELKPTYSGVNVTTITTNVFSSGSPSSGSEVTIDTSQDGSVNSGEQTGGIDAMTGTVINAWGANDAGSLPVDFSRFSSRRTIFQLGIIPTWVAGSYKSGARVKLLVGGVLRYYQANTNTSTTPPGAAWTEFTEDSYFGTSIRYSPWTKDKATIWKNSGGDPRGTESPFGDGEMWDGNLIVNDDTTFRTWADIKSTSDSFDTRWKYGNSSSGVYDGLRCLIPTGSPTGAFAGTDPNGKSFANSVAEYRDGAWYVKYNVVDYMQCAVMDEGEVYMYFSGSWSTIAPLDNGNDCFHPYDSLTNTESAIKKSTGSQYSGTNNNSAITVQYTWSPIMDWLSEVFVNRTNTDWYKSGAWLNIRIPLPINTMNGITEAVGELYGGTSSIKAPTTIDAQNMTYSHDGKRGFNQGSSSEDLAPINAIDFWMKLHYTGSDFGITYTDMFKGNFKMRCFLFDRNDNVVYQDFTIMFNNTWQSISLPLSGFQVYRGRRPRYGVGFVNDLIPPKQLDPQNIFEWRHIKQICWQTQESYDEYGRYQAGRGDFGLVNFQPFLFRRIKLSMDALRFRKPLLVNTGQISDRVIEPDFIRREDIVIYDQLKSESFTELEKAQFQHEEYQIDTTGRFDIKFGDYFFLKDNEIIDRTDNGDNTIKLVAKRIEYSITKPKEGKGGLLRTIRGVRRFV